jgi:hypothetical protein
MSAIMIAKELELIFMPLFNRATVALSAMTLLYAAGINAPQ